MANPDTPFGLRPYRGVKRVTKYKKDASAARIFKGDLVQLEADGFIIVSAASPAAGTVLGVAAHDTTASKAEDVLIYDDPDQVFEIQHDGTSAATDRGINCNVTVTTGNTTTGVSKHELDTSEIATTASLPFKIIGLVDRVDNAEGLNAKVLVKLNGHVYGDGDGSTGI